MAEAAVAVSSDVGSADTVANTGAATPNAAVGADAPWYGGMDPDTQSWLSSKGFNRLDAKAALAETVNGYRNAEKFIGVPASQLVKLPTDPNDAASWEKVYTQLGRPQTPNDYKFDIPKENADEGLVNWAKGTFHKLGLPASTAENLTKEWNQYIGTAVEQHNSAWQASMGADEAALRQEWSSAHDHHIQVAALAQNKLGIDAGTAEKLAKAIGLSAYTKALYKIGTSFSEPDFIGGEGAALNGRLSPEEAKAKISSLMNDNDFRARFDKGERKAHDEWNALHASL